MTLFPIGSIITYKERDYCVLSSRVVGRGVIVAAAEVSSTPDQAWWHSFYFTSELLAQVNTRASLQEGRQGVEGDQHER